MDALTIAPSAGSALLGPIVGLAAWTMVMWIWMYATRIPAMIQAEVDADALAKNPEFTLDQALPPQIQWKAHNYNHLHEAPTVFYAVALVLIIVGHGDGLNALLGWIYLALRVVHSLIQVTVNKVMVRFVVFTLSSLVLLALTIRAAIAVLI